MNADGAPHDLVLVIADLGGGGAQRVLTTLANAWAARGVRVCVVTLAGTGGDHFALDERLTRVALGRTGAAGNVFAGLVANIGRVRALRRAIRQSGAPSVLSFVGATNILTVLATAGLGLRVVISERNDPARQSLGRGWDLLRRLLYRRAAVVTANSDEAMRALARFVPRTRLVRVPNPMPAATGGGDDEATDTILAVGRLAHQKAHDVLLRAFAALADEVPGWQLVIVGTGELGGALAAQADDLGIAGRVKWAGQVADTGPWYRAARIFALPSRYEGMPNALLEAMAAGLAVVVSDGAAGALAFVTAGETGLVAPVEDAEALAAALRRLIGDAELRRRLGDAARRRIEREAGRGPTETWDRILGWEADDQRDGLPTKTTLAP